MDQKIILNKIETKNGLFLKKNYLCLKYDHLLFALKIAAIIQLFVRGVTDADSKLVAAQLTRGFKLASEGISLPFNEVCIVADVKPLER